MWQAQSKFIDPKVVYQTTIFDCDRQLTYLEAIRLWQKDESFRTFFIKLLADAPFPAYFWETPPITKFSSDRVFEFVLINSFQLQKVPPNPNSFKSYFQKTTKEVVAFDNLRSDALLIVPCPLAETSAYRHLASFVQTAPKSQQHLLWQTVGQELEKKLNQKPIWISTAGLGVYWLHIRLDSYPKYYRFKAYKQ